MRVLVVTNMWPSEQRPHWGAFVKSQVDSLSAAGIENTIHEIEGWKSMGRYVSALRALPAIAKRCGAQLVHAHYGYSGAACARVRLPLVVSFCGDDLLGRPDEAGRLSFKSRALIPLSRWAAGRADGVIVKSEEMRRVIPGVADVNVIPNGVDMERFSPQPRDQARAALGWPVNGQVLLFAANPEEPRKNFALARHVEMALRARGADARLEHVYGRPQSVMVQAMNAADVLLLPSYHEGSPNVVKEAMSCGLPVVAAPVGDCEERLRDCAPSAVVARTGEAFTEATARVLAAGTRSNGRERVAALALPAVARRVMDVYERAIARFRGGR
ncbi:MAG: glycosyltransferase [Candidatus Eisenbacteria bacterium]|nr:glycosyltransferase [Candidatus Eisenbacteria bacterium]